MSDAETVLATLQREGLPAPAAAGVLGNQLYEDGATGGTFNTRAKGDGGQATGIAQWHPDRWSNLLAYARRSGADPYALNTQVGFAITEAKSIKLSGGKSLWDTLRNTNDPFAASKLWMTKFERPKDQSDSAALARLKRAQDALKGSTGGGSGLDLSGLGSSIAGAAKGAASALIPQPIVDAAGAVGSAAGSVGGVFDHLLWWFNPNHQLRVGIGIAGAVAVLLGLYLLGREARA